MTRAALYCRISQDELGQGLGVQRQLDDARALAASRGWEVVGEYVDNDTSAYSGVQRKAYERLMQDANAQRVDRIVVWHPSRLWRRRSERVADIEKLSRLRVGITCVRGPELDLGSAYGRSMAVIMGEFDTAESEVKSERITRASLQRAQEGRSNGAVAYGWKREYTTDPSGRVLGFRDVEHPEEAEIVREVVGRLLAGEALRGISDDLNARQVTVPSRKPDLRWRHQTLTKLALRPSNAGKRIYQGQILGPAEWPALISESDYFRLVALLKAPERRHARNGARKNLLTYGIGACGVCGAPLRQHRRSGGVARYICTGKECVSRMAPPVDALVREVVVERLSKPDAASVFDGNPKHAAGAFERLEGIRARLDAAADQYADGAIDASQLARITARLRPDLDAAARDWREAQPPSLPKDVTGLLGTRARDAWDDLSVTGRRAVLGALGLTVVILPTKSGRGFDPMSVRFEWPPVELSQISDAGLV